MAESRDGTSGHGNAEELRFRRHAILSTALPFPQLDWSDAKTDGENLAEIRDYCITLGNSVLDWYLAHHQKKKRWAKALHFWMYFFVALGGIPPLLKLGFDNLLRSVFNHAIPDWFIDAVTNHAGELSVFFFGIAGAIKLWDTNFGFTADWMRFITTGMRLSQELTRFQFDWDRLDLAQRLRTAPQRPSDHDTPPAAAPPDGEERCATCGYSHPVKQLTPTQEKLKLAAEFCASVFATVNSEVSVWADELKKRVDRLPGHGAQDHRP